MAPMLRSSRNLHITPTTARTVGAGGEDRTMTAFFLPRASDDEQAERLYEALAEFAGCEPAPPGQRVRSIAFAQDGAQWVAEVGEELRGRRRSEERRVGKECRSRWSPYH